MSIEGYGKKSYLGSSAVIFHFRPGNHRRYSGPQPLSTFARNGDRRLIGKKVLQTDSSGSYHFTNLPPGIYTLTVTAPGFRLFKHTAINLDTGRLPTLDVTLLVGGGEQTVEVTGEVALVDVSQSRVQTNITEDLLANVPKGRSFQSVIQLAPGARTEPLQSSDISNSGARNSGARNSGYQIGGASNSENAYLVEGQETASPFDGRSASNVPMEFIQEVQVKTNGFEAEFGGALGGRRQRRPEARQQRLAWQRIPALSGIPL